jgi:hypothetical protein
MASPVFGPPGGSQPPYFVKPDTKRVKLPAPLASTVKLVFAASLTGTRKLKLMVEFSLM